MSRTVSPGSPRKPDRGDGTYLNPIVPGDHPDPTVLKDGEDYYMTFSSFLACPGIVIWHSRDLINWHPLQAVLKKPLGSVYAMDLVKHKNRYYIYIPVVAHHRSSIYVIHADHITGPWSDPVDLELTGYIDPGHALGEDGRRYLFVNGIRRVLLSDDGLSARGEPELVYTPWRYPGDWVVEMFAPEGPKIFRKGEYYYLISAVGGTAGPPTSHMITVARSKSVHGPWEDCPFNPVIRTWNQAEPWWSKGHGSLVEGPGGDWWLLYHGYEKGFRTLGRQTLLEPVEWTEEGWFRALGSDLSRPMNIPRGGSGSPGFSLSDDFSENKMGIQWSFFNPSPEDPERVQYGSCSLTLKSWGSTPADSPPLTCIPGDRSYETELTLEPSAEARGGLILFYDERMFCGIAFSRDKMFTYNYGQEQKWMEEDIRLENVRIRLTNRENIITYHYSIDEGEWIQHPWQMEVSGMHHNVLGGFTGLKAGMFSAGKGAVTFKSFTYRSISAGD